MGERMKIFHPLTPPWLEQLGEWLEDEEIRQALIGDMPIETLIEKMQTGEVSLAGLYDPILGHIQGCFSLLNTGDRRVELTAYCPGRLRTALPLIVDFARNRGDQLAHFKTRADRIQGWENLSVRQFRRHVKRYGFDFTGLLGSEKGWYLIGHVELYPASKNGKMIQETEIVGA